MSPEISERSFEDAIECALLQLGPDACPGDAAAMRKTARLVRYAARWLPQAPNLRSPRDPTSEEAP